MGQANGQIGRYSRWKILGSCNQNQNQNDVNARYSTFDECSQEIFTED